MTLTQKDPPKGLELLGNILLRSLRNLILKNRLHQQQRRQHMDDCFDDHDGLEWQDWMIIGPLSEDIARERRDIERTNREWDDQDDEYWDMINRRW
jgi:hypothetical protein